MANAVFSPKDFKAYVIEEATTGTSPAITAALFQLDVDSVSFPALNVNQVANVRSRTGRVASSDDFFQDNDMRAVEVSLSGVWHNDAGHGMLLQSVAGAALAGAAADVTIGTAATTKAGKYGESETEKTFTLVLASPDQDDGHNILLKGCLCTNFSITADMGTDGGQYKFSATISSGRVPELNNTDAPGVGSGGSVYSSTFVDMAGIDVSAIKIFNLTPILSSFGVTIDSPAIYTGIDEGNGYACFGRAEEVAITANATVKLDSVTRGLPNSFDTQTTDLNAGLFTINQTSATATSIAAPAGILTNVAYNEGDAMMLDVEMKVLNNGSDAPIAFNLA